MIRRLTAAVIALMLLCGTALADYKELTVGSKDSTNDWAVYSLQLKLIELDYLDGIADGIFGSGTAKAVSAFQEDYNLEATGVADVATQELLFSLEAATEPGATPSPAEEEVLDTGDVNNDVFIVQNNLFIWGFITDEPDGIFGSGTKQALSDFQKYSIDMMVEYNGTKSIAEATPEPTPEPTVSTYGAYQMEMVEDIKISSIPTDGTLTAEWMDFLLNGFKPDVVEVSEDDKGDDVKRVQTRLVALGYMAAGNDGYFGEHSKVALRYFQRRNGLDETGWVDKATEMKLFSGNAVTSDKYVSMYKAMVSVTDQRVYIYQWTGEDYTALVHTFKCSSGAVATPTILGTFQAPGRNGEWYWMEDSKVWVKYAFVIDGGYFFHSVLFRDKDGSPTKNSVAALGTRVSHGCIRLAVEDAEWIYNNCASGMTVVIYED